MSAAHMLPHQVEILYDFEATNPICVGSIISSYFILTIATCVAGRRKSAIKIRARREDQTDQIRSIEEFYAYAARDQDSSPFDVALIRLNSTLDLDNDHIFPIDYEQSQTALPEHLSCQSSICQNDSGNASVKTVSPSECSEILVGKEEKIFMCTELDSALNVTGDWIQNCVVPLAGSSLICRDPAAEADFLLGVLAIDEDNKVENGGKRLYTNVGAYSHWIQLALQGDEPAQANEFDLQSTSFGGSVIDQETDPVPYQLSIRLDGTGHVCGGVILDKKTALSAAHCFKFSSERYTVVAGEQNLTTTDGTEQEFKIETLFKHPSSKPMLGMKVKTCDIAVIQIKGEFEFNQRVNNVWISSQSTPNSNSGSGFQGLNGTATGWGKAGNHADRSNVLMAVDLELMEHKVCKKKWSFLKEHMLCGYNTISNVCEGDSGGPLVLKDYPVGENQTRDLLIGISSFAPRECEKRDEPNGFTNVSYFYKWIADKRSNSLCSPCQFQCFNGQCIHEELKCDKKYDCEDGSDEKMCRLHSQTKRVNVASCPKVAVDQSKHPVPYQLSIRYSGRHYCGGVILDKRTALSAAHCFSSRVPITRYTVVAGEQNLDKKDGTEQVLQIQSFFKHPGYEFILSGNDIAVIQIEGEFNFTQRVNNVWISSPSTPDYRALKWMSTGWGQTETDGPASNVLRSIELEFTDHEECKKKLPSLQPSAFCATNNVSNICGGDGGGPLVIKKYDHGPNKTTDLLVGISSLFPRDCERQDQPNGFTNVTQFFGWIAEHRSNSLCPSPQFQFQCFNGQCIDEELKCDSKFDCEDGSDEKMCQSYNRVSRACGGLIQVDYSHEIEWQAPASHPHQNSSCLWIIANPHQDRQSNTTIQILNDTHHTFDNATSQLSVVQNLSGNQTSTFLLDEIGKEYNFSQPFLMLHFRTNSSAPNNGIHLRITEQSEPTHKTAKHVQGIDLKADLNQNTAQNFSHVYSGSHCRKKEKSRQILQRAPPQNLSTSSQNPSYIVSIKSNGRPICNGILLDKKTALFTASCFGGREIRELRIVAGESKQNPNLNRVDSTEQILKIEKIIKHRKLKHSIVSQKYDIALVHVKGEFTFNEHVNNILISAPETLNLKGVSGSMAAKTLSNPQMIDIKLTDLSACPRTHPSFTDSMLCAVGNGTNVCRMTGAPFVLKNHKFNPRELGRDILIGISTFGPSACESIGQPVPFTRVDHFYDWIEKNRAKSSCSDSQFQCYNGQCIPKELKCNYAFDCSDGSDEVVCTVGRATTIKTFDSCARRPANQREIENKLAMEDQWIEINTMEHENLFLFLKPMENGRQIQVHLQSLQMKTAQDSLNVFSYRQNTQNITNLQRFRGAGNWSNNVYEGDANEPVLLYFHAEPSSENQEMTFNYSERVAAKQQLP